MTRHRIVVAGALAGALLLAPAAPAGPGVGLVAGDLVRVGGVGVHVPPPGQGVTLHAMSPEGDRTIRVLHRAGGAIEVMHSAAGPAVPMRASAAGASACRDDAFAHDVYVQQDYAWSLNVASAPSNVAGAVERAAVKGIGAVPAALNDCGIADRVAATQRYLGNTSQEASIDESGDCRPLGNLANEVSFGEMPRGILGLACVRFLIGIPKATVLEADIKLNKTEYRWTTGPGPSCRSKLDVRSVVTHESGHVFGLSHVAEATHPHLTMSEVTPYCSRAPRTFGRGDVKGLEALY